MYCRARLYIGRPQQPNESRVSLSKRVRFDVFKRDKFTCQYCGQRPPDVMLEVDHVHPICDGGTDEPGNLTTACFACNRGKAGKTLGDVLPAINELELLAGVQEMLERAAAMKQSHAVAMAQREAEDTAVATIRTWWRTAFGDERYVEDATLRQFLKRLPLTEISDAVDATEAKDSRSNLSYYSCWRYFCGVCWAKIKAGAEVEE